MKQILKYLLAVAALSLCGQAVAEGPFDRLRESVEPGGSIVLTTPTVVEGVVISDYRSPNMELNPNLNYYTVDLETNDRTVYIQAADGSCGIRLVFDEASENRLVRYDRVRLDLNGCRLTRMASPDCLTLEGVSALNVRSVTPGVVSDAPIKERTIAQLTDNDLYTFVTLRDAEFIFKEGAYTNIWEPYAQFCNELHHYKYDINNRMDGWASLVRDAEGGAIYMLVNTLCTWRRAGKPLPQGMGPLSGIVVHTPMRRYGGEMGRYSIRPFDESDIAVSRKRNSPWKRLTGWLLDGSAGASLQFELLGYQNLGTEGKKGDRVLNDVGNSRGYLWTDCGAFVHVEADYNALGTQDRGWASNGAVVFKAPTPDWYRWDNMGRMVGSNAFYMSFSTKKIRGTDLQLSFEWGAGNQDGNFSWNFPLEWNVEYAVDGGDFQLLRDAATGQDVIVLRSLPWWDKVIDGSGHSERLYTPYDCGMGLQQHVFSLPASVFGHDEVVVRLSPASGLLSQVRANPAHDVLIPTAVVRKNCKQTTVIRFGTISVDYK